MGQRGPRPLPSNVHRLKGNPSKLSSSQLGDGVNPDVEIPAFPPELDQDARKEWRRITPILRDLGLITKLDRAVLAVYCQEWARWLWVERKIADAHKRDPEGVSALVWDTPSGYKQVSVLLNIARQSQQAFIRAAAEFGMSPSSRSKATPSAAQPSLPGFGPPGGAMGFDSL